MADDSNDSSSFSYDFRNTNSNPFTCLFFAWNVKRRDEPIIINEQYLKGECLGRGNYSEVFEVLDKDTLQRRAMKLYRMAYIRKDYNSGHVLELIRNEINITKRLNHKNVIKILDTSNESVYITDNIYLIMEYCAISVDELMNSTDDKKLPIYQSRKYFIDLINGVDYLHSIGIVHRDIKPDNLLLANDDTLKISDFTVCEVLNTFDYRDSSRHRHGTIDYQPPEIFTSCDVEEYFLYGYKIDIWSCGVTLYKMITSKLPFKSHFLGTHVINDDFKIRSDFATDPFLIDFFSKLFIKEPETRINIDGIRQHPWFNRQLPKHFIPMPARNDDYRSLTMTPSIHQQYYPLEPAENIVKVPDKNITEFETLKKIPIIRCNRSQLKRKPYNCDHLIKRLYKILSSFILSNKLFRNYYTRESRSKEKE